MGGSRLRDRRHGGDAYVRAAFQLLVGRGGAPRGGQDILRPPLARVRQGDGVGNGAGAARGGSRVHQPPRKAQGRGYAGERQLPGHGAVGQGEVVQAGLLAPLQGQRGQLRHGLFVPQVDAGGGAGRGGALRTGFGDQAEEGPGDGADGARAQRVRLARVRQRLPPEAGEPARRGGGHRAQEQRQQACQVDDAGYSGGG